MATEVLNPYNKLALDRLVEEPAITLTDIVPFGDLSASAPNTRKATLQAIVDVITPAIDCADLPAEPAIVVSDVLPFSDASAADPKARKVTLQQIIDVITPLLSSELLPIFVPTGAVIDYACLSAPSGWLLSDGRTIGNATSGGTSRANSDTQTLFELLWDNYANADLPIQDSAGAPSTRGSFAAADYAASKRLPLPDFRGRVRAGKDNMGGSAANRLTAAGSGIDGTILGAVGGEEEHTLTEGEMPAHDHTEGSVTTTLGTLTGGASPIPATAVTADTSTTGSGDPHNNTQPTAIITTLIKL